MSSTEWRDDARPFDWNRVFGRVAPRLLDVGCGDGQFLIRSALARPEVDHLGIELVRPVLVRAVKEADARGLQNVRFAAGDALAWLDGRLEPGSIDEIHLYHPQPYFDPAEIPRGTLPPAFFELAWRAMRRGGLLVLQSDHRGYGRHLLEASRRLFDPEEQRGPWPDAPEGRTRREIVARRKGMKVRRILARRRDAPSGAPVPPPYFAIDRLD